MVAWCAWTILTVIYWAAYIKRMVKEDLVTLIPWNKI